MTLHDFGQQNVCRALGGRMSGSGNNAALYPVIIEWVGQGTKKRIMAKIEAGQGRIHREIGLIPLIAADLPRNALVGLAKTLGIMNIWADTPVYAMLDQAGPNLGASLAHECGHTGKGVVIAILDTGVFPHPDLTTPENRILAWRDLVNNRPGPYDDNGHGTHLAGVIAGNGLSSQGRFCGIAPESRLVAVKVLNQEGMGRLSDLIAGLEWCLIHQATLNIKAVNLSLGTAAQADPTRDLLCRAVGLAVQRGITICASCGGACRGNGAAADIPAMRGVNSPSISPKIIAVGNYDGQKTFSEAEIVTYQKAGPAFPAAKPDLVAPGVNISSLNVDGDYRTLSGASVAASLVTGAIALILQKWPSLPPDRIKGLLQKNARNLGVGVNLQGAGILNLEDLFGLARKNTAKTATPHGPNDELLKILLGLVGQSAGTANPGGELLKNMLFSLLKGLK